MIEEYKKDKQELADKIWKLIHDFEKKYNSYVRKVNLIHEGERTYDGHSDLEQLLLMWKLNLMIKKWEGEYEKD